MVVLSLPVKLEAGGQAPAARVNDEIVRTCEIGLPGIAGIGPGSAIPGLLPEAQEGHPRHAALEKPADHWNGFPFDLRGGVERLPPAPPRIRAPSSRSRHRLCALEPGRASNGPGRAESPPAFLQARQFLKESHFMSEYFMINPKRSLKLIGFEM